MCYQYCSEQSALPIRDILADHNKGNKSEPNYETATYNWCVNCNQPSVRAAVNDGLTHILFITKYTGTVREYRDRYFIVGYYAIGWTDQLEERVAIRAKKLCFAPIEKAYEITPERWKRINTSGKTLELTNLRYATQRIREPLLEEIINHIYKGNALDSFLHEAAYLKSQYNPFDSIPKGKIFIINVGANTASPLQSPAFSDGTFEFTPIPEYTQIDSGHILSLKDLRQFNAPEKPFIDLFPEGMIDPIKNVHNDPEFLTFTYGDNIEQKRNLQKLQTGDFLFFLARLVPYSGGIFQHKRAYFALIGFLEIAERLDDPTSPLFTSPAFIRSAHVIRYLTDPASLSGFAIYKGSTNSRRFKYAVRFDREFVEYVPLLKADGSLWDWSRTTELGIIGSNTRTARMFIDPSTEIGRGQAKRFWLHIWKTQKWEKMISTDKRSC